MGNRGEKWLTPIFHFFPSSRCVKNVCGYSQADAAAWRDKEAAGGGEELRDQPSTGRGSGTVVEVGVRSNSPSRGVQVLVACKRAASTAANIFVACRRVPVCLNSEPPSLLGHTPRPCFLVLDRHPALSIADVMPCPHICLLSACALYRVSPGIEGPSTSQSGNCSQVSHHPFTDCHPRHPPP